MEYRIFNEDFEAIISDLGAQVIALNNLDTGAKYLWCGDNNIWGGVSPILFPFVGPLKDKTYTVEGKSYELNRHGFARISVWQLKKINDFSAEFVLCSNEKTREVYPFEFELSVLYTITESGLRSEFCVRNTDNKAMYYALGGHTAFATEGSEDGMSECTVCFPVEADFYDNLVDMSTGLINHEKRLMFSGNSLKLNQHLFDNDTLIFDCSDFSGAKLIRQNHDTVLFVYEGFKVLAFWKKLGTGRFICIEPWTGLPEAIDAPKEISQKPNLEKLDASEQKKYYYEIRILN